jgi:soluble lytic murein transglycosylase
MIHQKPLYLAASILLLTVLACSLQSTPEPIIVTATPLGGIPTQGPIIITATPEITATPVPVSTATLPPNEGIAQAELAVRNGNYEQAVSLYQAVLRDGFIGADLRAEAAYSLGQAAVREGLFESAIGSLTDFISQFPNDSRIGQAYFLRGEAYLGASLWAEAIADFQQYLALKPGVIDSYAHERIGDAYLNLGENARALEAYQHATESARTLPAQLALREKLAVGYITVGSLDAAIQQYDAILSEARNGVYRANIEYQAAQLEIASGKTAQGYARLQAMMEIYPTTPAAYTAMLDLLNAGIPVDDWLRAQIAYANEDYLDALNALNRYTTQLPVAPVEALLMLGRCYRALGNFPAAYTTFQTILDQYTSDPSYGLAWLEQGRTLFMEGDYPNAINRYTALATTNPQLPEAPEALWRAGYLYSQQGDTEAALATFDILATNYPGTEQAQSGLLIAATLAYNAGQIQRAQAFYTQLANTGTGSAKAQAFLWLGRLYQQAGQTDLAIQSYTGAAQADPGGYFSVRAEDLLAGREPFQPPRGYQFTFDDAQEIADAEQWLRTVFGIQQEGTLYPLSETLANDPRIIRGQELWELADFEAAKTEFENLREAYTNDPLATYQLAVYFKEIGLYRSSITAAAALIDQSGYDNFNAPRYLVRLRYPIYYSDLVLPAAEEWKVDPLLIFSLIRQESLYEGFATSFAAAQGLMQIIPATGYEINQRLNYDSNYQNSDVYRPYVNVYFGTFYLSWVRDLVDGQPYAALAGYNGGPGNAREWLDISGPDIDLFVQTITFDETKLYVERIYEQYTVYRQIYGVE